MTQDMSLFSIFALFLFLVGLSSAVNVYLRARVLLRSIDYIESKSKMIDLFVRRVITLLSENEKMLSWG